MLFTALVVSCVSIAISDAFSNTITKIKETFAFFAKAGDGISEHIKNKTKSKWDKHSKKDQAIKKKEIIVVIKIELIKRNAIKNKIVTGEEI